jgi:hypothetical protein
VIFSTIAQHLGIADSVVSLTSDGRVDLQTTGIEAIHNKDFWQARQYSDPQIQDDNNKPSDHSSIMASNSDPINDIENMDRTRQIGDLSVYITTHEQSAQFSAPCSLLGMPS